MALKEYFVGSIGPLYYNDAGAYPDSEPLESFRGPQIYIENAPTEDYHAARKVDLPGPGGSDTHVQYNDGGTFGGKDTFTFDPDTNTVTIVGTTSLKPGVGYEPSLWISSSGRIASGFSSGTPSYAFSFEGTSGKGIGLERNTLTDGGQILEIVAGGAKSGATNTDGGYLRLKSGIATGSGSSCVEIWTVSAGASGTADRTATLKVTIASNGSINIPSGQTYNIGGSAHAHSLDDLSDAVISGAADGQLLYYNGVNWTNLANSGWIPHAISWTYASATTFTVAGNVTAIFGVGTKLKWTQSSTVYYGYVASSSYSSPNTTVTVAGNAVLNDTISSPYYSYESNPQGFPHWFDYTPTWTGFSTAPSGGKTRFVVIGRTEIVNIDPTIAGVSNDTVLTFTLPIAAASGISRFSATFGVGFDNGSIVAYPCRIRIDAGSNVVTCFNLMTGAWTNSGGKNFYVTCMCEI